jgi:CBS domain containing-hemolysin-like protein
MDLFDVVWRVGATLLFVALNGFFVAAEFALVKVRAVRIESMAEQGRRAARDVRTMLSQLDLYLSACQLGITMSSLALGALGEPAVSVLILAAARSVGLSIDPTAGWLPIISVGLAFVVITILHMTVGEQAPKMWALRRAETTAVKTAGLLRVFTTVFGPFISIINSISNWMVGLTGLSADSGHEPGHTAEEIRSILSLSAEAGHISSREREITENVFQLMELEVRHIIVPRGDVEYLSLATDPATNFELLRSSTHSRLPLCDEGLDTIVGVVHVKDVFRSGHDADNLNLASVAREPLFVPDTMALSNLLGQMQRTNQRCAAVINEHGTVVGLTFLEDALEEIVGPLGDEFDELEQLATDFVKLGEGVFEVAGRLALPDILRRLQIDLNRDDENEDTIGGYVTALLGRLPRRGDSVPLGPYRVTVLETSGKLVQKLRVERTSDRSESAR